MSGYTKHKCEIDFEKAQNDINKYIKNIKPLLPAHYDFDVIKSLLEEYYHYELLIINQNHKNYLAKEKSLHTHNKKSRYTIFVDVDSIIRGASEYRKIMCKDYIHSHELLFDDSTQKENIEKFSVIRTPKINRINAKIEKALLKTQQVEPDFLDKLMGLYNRKNTSQKDRVYIMKELEKYFCDKVVQFFYKKVDTEFNAQLREMAVFHLQSLGFQPVLRRQKYMVIPTKNKKRRVYYKQYAKQRFNIDALPQELEYRIDNSKEQGIKHYDYFISHSSIDFEAVQTLIQDLNKKGKNIYCDWINDTDYLKRNLAGSATLNVILKRIEQSDNLIFVVSKNSLKSKWCKYELNHYAITRKKIFFIEIETLLDGKFDLNEYTETWYLDPLYKELELFKASI